MDLEAFNSLPRDRVAELVRAAGPKVCVFPINGTRRWFALECEAAGDESPVSAYLDFSARRHVELYRLCFDNGLDTLLTPIFGPDLTDRGNDYLQMAVDGLARPAADPVFTDFYHSHEVRVRFYGDYRRFFYTTPYAYLVQLFEQLTVQTEAYSRHRLFFGVCAQDASEWIAQMAVEYFAVHGRAPDREALVTRYYGEFVGPVDLFIGFDKFCTFDMPLVASANEDLYFTVTPSPYLTEQQLRGILYDHLYSRRGGEPDYAAMTPDDWTLLREFYQANLGRTLGIGARQERGGYWYPLPQVTLPAGFDRSSSHSQPGD
jgi:adenosine tuberculosinyltransferase